MANKPPPQDTSQSRNEYIPAFISQRPFWSKVEGQDESTADADYLEHQRLQAAPKDTLDKAKWYDRGRKAGPAATKYRKGACENCGAITHKTKDCLSRPRKHGAKWTGRDIQADEVIDEVKLGWDAKRDRWNGYDAREYTSVVQEYQELEAMKQAVASQGKDGNSGVTEIQKSLQTSKEGTPAGTAADASDAKYAEETDMGRSQPTSTRQLRLREDTAKYLVNLDLDSTRYDPKTRSMDTSTQNLSSTNGTNGEADDGFVRPSSTNDDAAAFERAQKYAWETQENSSNINNDNTSTAQAKLHLQANPTEGMLLMKKAESEAAEKKAAHRKALLEKYGQDLVGLPTNNNNTVDSATTQNTNASLSLSSSTKQKPTILSSSSTYVEYDEHGNPKPAPNTANGGSTSQGLIQAKPIARSKYAEDVYPGNHTSVFGSWWRDFTWGYRCCHSTVRNSYCTGEEGIRAWEEAEGLRMGMKNGIDDLDNGGDDNVGREEEDAQEDADVTVTNSKSKSNGDGEARKVISLVEEKKRSEGTKHRTTVTEVERKKKKRTLEELQSGISEEDMENYKRNRLAADDPMAKLLGKDELVS